VCLWFAGYSTCHWCHVMERESFENQSIADIMNSKFINIKLDREGEWTCVWGDSLNFSLIFFYAYMLRSNWIDWIDWWNVNIVSDPERPNIDGIYMKVVQAISGSGGWPMSIWMTPDLLPFYAGTYFPPEDRYYGRPGFKAILLTISEHVRFKSSYLPYPIQDMRSWWVGWNFN